MSSDVVKHLRSEIKLASWDMLGEHHERGALFLLGNDVDLAVAGAAIATDDAKQVKSWLTDRKLILTKELEWQNEAPNSFIFLIVQPYVLIQRVSEN